MKLKNIIQFPTIVKVQIEKEGHGSINLTQERSIKLLDKPLIPRDIIESDLSLQSYLEENVKENRNHE